VCPPFGLIPAGAHSTKARFPHTLNDLAELWGGLLGQQVVLSESVINYADTSDVTTNHKGLAEPSVIKLCRN